MTTPLTFTFDPAADGISTNDYTATLPKRRHSVYAKGRPLYMPRTGLVLTPCQMHSDGSWTCVVTIGSATYPTDGYSLWVGREEIETAIDLTEAMFIAANQITQLELDIEAQEYADGQPGNSWP